MRKEEILLKLQEHKSYIQSHFKVKKIGLFGSYAQNVENSNSDIDFYVEFKEKSFDNLAGLWVYLEEQFNKKIDIVYPHKNSNKVFLEHIQKSVIYG